MEPTDHDEVRSSVQAEFEAATDDSFSLNRARKWVTEHVPANENAMHQEIKTGEDDDDGDGLPLAAKR